MSDNPAKVKINLANEYWEEVLVCLPRHNLANQVALSCHLFSEVADFLLFNMRRRVTLQKMLLASQLHVQGPECAVPNGNVNNGELCNCLRLRNKRGDWFNIPEQPLPENIVDFEELTIGPIDLNSPVQLEPALLLFDRMRPFFDNINLKLCYDDDSIESNFFEMWAKLMPVVGSAYSISGFDFDHTKCQYQDRFRAFLFGTSLLHVDRAVKQNDLDRISFSILHQKHMNPDEPQSCECRIIIMENNNDEIIFMLLMSAVSFCFREAQAPITFFIRYDHHLPPNFDWDELVFERQLNARTGEQLCSEHLGPNRVLVSRTVANVDPIWLAHKKTEVTEWSFDAQQKRRRLILRPDYAG